MPGERSVWTSEIYEKPIGPEGSVAVSMQPERMPRNRRDLEQRSRNQNSSAR